jgi:hypothetical protein
LTLASRGLADRMNQKARPPFGSRARPVRWRRVNAKGVRVSGEVGV